MTKSLRIFIPDSCLDKKHHKYVLSQTTLSPLYETSDNIELFSNLKYASSISRDFLKVLLYNPFDTLGFDKFFRAHYFTSFPRRHNLTTFLKHFDFTKKWSCNLPRWCFSSRSEWNQWNPITHSISRKRWHHHWGWNGWNWEYWWINEVQLCWRVQW